MEPRQPSLTGPGLGELDELGADSATSEIGMNTGLVRDVEDVPFLVGLEVPHHLPVDESDPEVLRDQLRPLAPPFGDPVAPDLDRALLREVGFVARRDESGYARCVVQRRWADRQCVQSGWPDSNRRLPAPKAGTLTRLSYTPQMPEV